MISRCPPQPQSQGGLGNSSGSIPLKTEPLGLHYSQHRSSWPTPSQHPRDQEPTRLWFIPGGSVPLKLLQSVPRRLGTRLPRPSAVPASHTLPEPRGIGFNCYLHLTYFITKQINTAAKLRRCLQELEGVSS